VRATTNKLAGEQRLESYYTSFVATRRYRVHACMKRTGSRQAGQVYIVHGL